jgi:hypothetical protein
VTAARVLGKRENLRRRERIPDQSLNRKLEQLLQTPRDTLMCLTYSRNSKTSRELLKPVRQLMRDKIHKEKTLISTQLPHHQIKAKLHNNEAI